MGIVEEPWTAYEEDDDGDTRSQLPVLREAGKAAGAATRVGRTEALPGVWGVPGAVHRTGRALLLPPVPDA